MRNLIFYILVALSFNIPLYGLEKDCLVNNGNFEEKLKNWKTNWFKGSLSTDARSGNYAVKLIKRKNIKFDRLRSSFVVKKGKLYEVTFWTKGQNTTLVFLLFWGPKMEWGIKPISGNTTINATGKWTLNRFLFKAPQKNINLQLRACRKAGYILIDDIKIVPFIPREAKPKTIGKPRGQKIDFVNWGHLRSRPYLNRPDLLADGDLTTRASFQAGPEVGGNIDFFFPKPIFVTDFRFVQSTPGLTGFKITGDINGDRKFDKAICTKNYNSVIKDKWLQVAVNEKVYGLRFAATSGSAGYRTPFPNLCEVEIYSTDKIKKSSQRIVKYINLLSSQEKLNWPKLNTNPRDLDIIICSDFFMMGLDYKGSNLPEDLNSYPPFKIFVKNLKRFSANAVRLFPEMSCSGDIMPWPSKICPHTKQNILKKVVDALHENDIKVYMFLHAWITPLQDRKRFGRERWGYPYEQADRNSDPAKKRLYPCIISDNDFRDKWLTILLECAAQGVDGIYLYPDEYYYKGHSLAGTKCPNCQKNFKAMFGYDSLPAKADDTEKYREWKLFEYMQIVRLGQYWKQKLYNSYPDLKITSIPNVGFQEVFNKRLEHGICGDMLHKIPNCSTGGAAGRNQYDISGATAAARRYEACAAGGKTVQFHSIFTDRNDSSFPMKLIAPIASTVMNKMNSTSIYRYNYLFFSGWDKYVERAFKMARLLQTWGVYKGDTPTDTCLLLSRASEDWWEIAIKGVIGRFELGANGSSLVDRVDQTNLASILESNNSDSKLKIERFRGHYANKCMEGLLLQYGVQYKLQYTDMKLNNLSKYKLLILPFSYSLSISSFKKIKEAVNKGVKLFIVDMLGQCNEYGIKYSKPLLQELLKSPNVKYLNMDLATYGMDRLERQKLMNIVEEMLPVSRIKFNNYGKRVEFLINEISKSNKIIFIANWEKTDIATVNISIPMPSGKYKLTICDSLSGYLQEGTINSKKLISGEILKSFCISLKPGQVKLIHIKKSETKY